MALKTFWAANIAARAVFLSPPEYRERISSLLFTFIEA